MLYLSYFYNGSPSSQIAIATPGRLLEILKQKAVKLDKVKVVVVDEVWVPASTR